MIQDSQRSELYEALIGTKRTDYYLKQFASFDARGGGFYPSWNWAAFIFSVLWVQYRKLHDLFWVLLLIVFLGLIPIGRSLEVLSISFYVACLISLGVYANALYYRRTNKIIAKAHAQQPDPQKLLPYLRSRGDVDKRNPELFVFLIVVGSMMVFAYGAREDYIVRSHVQRAVKSADGTRKAIESLVRKGHMLGALPVDSEGIGAVGSSTFDVKYLSRVSYDNKGVVTITMADHMHFGAARNQTLLYVPTLHNGQLAWELSENSTVPPKYLPNGPAWSPRKYEDRFLAIENGTDRETTIAELGEPRSTTTKLFLRQSNGVRVDDKRLPETAYYLIWQHRDSVFVIGFDETDRSTEKLDGLRFP
jgi:hypothetical protein